MNRKSGDSLALKATKILHKTNGSTYNLTYKRLRCQLLHLQLQVAEGNILLTKHCERQRCLLDLILHQDMILQYLQLQLLQPGHLSVCGSATPEQVCKEQSQHAAQCSCAQQTRQDTQCSRQALQLNRRQDYMDLQRPPPHPEQQQQEQFAASWQSAALPVQEAECSSNPTSAASSYTSFLLRTATEDELRLVASLSAEQWRMQFYELFMQLVVLLELVNRCDALCADTPPNGLQEPPETRAAAAGSTSAGGTAAVVATAAHSAENLMAPAVETCYGAGPAASLQQLHDMVDRYTRLVLIAYLYHHVPLLEACMTNYVTHQRSAPAPSHWQRVARRLQLSDLQMLHMSIGHEEYGRLNKAASAECSALVSQAATPSLLIAAAAQIEAQSKAPGLCRQAAGGPAAHMPASAAPSSVPAAAAAVGRPEVKQLTGSRSSSRHGSGSGSSDGEAPCAAKNCARINSSLGQQQQLQTAAEDDDEAAAAAAGEVEGDPAAQLDDQLRRHMGCRHLQLRMIAMFYLNTLTRLQIAHLVVSAFPYFPSLTAVAEIVHREWQQQQQQQCLQQLEPKNEDASEDYDKPWQQQQQQQLQQQAMGQYAFQTVESPGAELLQQQVQQHLQHRSSLLQQQHLRWWGEVAECSLQLGGSALQQLLLQQQMKPE